MRSSLPQRLHSLSLFTCLLATFSPAVHAVGASPGSPGAARGGDGPNRNGVLILHAADAPENSNGTACEIVEFYDPLASCEEAETNIDDDGFFRVHYFAVYAAFPLRDSPRVVGMTFGIDYDPETVFLTYSWGEWGPCTADFELAEDGWPSPGSGTALTWDTVQTEHLLSVYAFAGYEYYGRSTSFDLIPHPTQGGNFVDDSILGGGIIDPVVDYGRLGFNDDPGYLPCPTPDPEGACCLDDGSCVRASEFDCTLVGGSFVGDDVPCDPDPCVAVPTQESSWGLLKKRFRPAESTHGIE